MIPQHDAASPFAPRLALFIPAADETADSLDTIPTNGKSRNHGKPSPAWTLRTFFTRWYLPIVLVGEKDASPETVRSYGESLDWWEKLTDDPRLDELDGFALAAFKSGLRSATYRRGPNSPLRPLKPYTVAKHAKQIRAIMLRCGSSFDGRTLTAGVVTNVPYLRVETPRRLTPAATFTLDEARKLATATAFPPTTNDDRRRGRAARNVGKLFRARWTARMAIMFYCGLRISTVQRLTVEMNQIIDGRRWLVIGGGEIKTKNALAVPLHSEAAAALDALHVASGRYFPKLNKRSVARQHDALQVAAGLVASPSAVAGTQAARRAKPLGFHAWRRLHAQQLNVIGATAGDLAAQLSLDHASGTTTRTHYSAAKAQLIERLPKLVEAPRDLDQRRMF